MSDTVIVAAIGAISLIIGAASGAYVTARRLPSEIRRTGVDTNHVAVDAANDALKLLKEAFTEQTKALTTAIEFLRQQVEAGQKQVSSDAITIVSLNKLLGQRMRDGEIQLHRIESLLANIDERTRRIDILQMHVKELVEMARRSGMTLPAWVEENGK